MHRLTAIPPVFATGTVLAIGAVLALSGCSSGGCSSGADSPEAAVKGLIEAAVAGGDSDDVCAFVAKGWSYTDKDVRTLEAEFADTPGLDYREGEQMGSTSMVKVSTDEQSWTFTVEADSSDNWTVSNFGSLNP